MSQLDRGIGKFVFSDRNLQRFVDAVTEHISTWRGDGRNRKQRVLTVGDLADIGVIKLRGSGSLGSGGDIEPGDFPTQLPDLTVPPAPTGLLATGAWTNVILEWDDPPFGNYAYTEIWRSEINDLGTASLVGSSIASVAADPIGTGQTVYYWVRFVSTSGVSGPFNGTGGTVAYTALVASQNFAAGITPVEIFSSLPATGNFDGRIVYLTTDKKIYQYKISIPGWSNEVDGADITAGSIVAGKLAVGAINAGDGVISNAAIENAQIKDLAVDNAKIANGTIQTAKIGTGQITNALIQDGTIQTAKIGLGQITNALIQTGTIQSAKIGTGQILSANIGSAEVGTLKVAGAAITAAVSLEVTTDTTIWNANLSAPTGYVTVASTTIGLGASGATPSTILSICKQLKLQLWQHASSFNFLTVGFTGRVMMGTTQVATINFDNIGVGAGYVNGAYVGEFASKDTMIIDTTANTLSGTQTVSLQVACTYWNSSGGPWLTVKASAGFFCYLHGAKR